MWNYANIFDIFTRCRVKCTQKTPKKRFVTGAVETNTALRQKQICRTSHIFVRFEWILGIRHLHKTLLGIYK